MSFRVYVGRILPALALLILAIPTASAFGQSGDLELEQFWGLIDSVHESLMAEEPIPTVQRQTLADSLDAFSTVRLPDGTSLAVDTAYLAALVRNEEIDVERAAAIFGAILADRDRISSARFRETDLESLDEILSSNRFQWSDAETANPLSSLWQRFINWTARLLARIWPGAGTGQVLNAIALGVISIVLALVLRFVYRNAMRSVIREASLDPMEGIPENLTADQAYQRARDLAATGDLRDGVRYLYLAALYRLEENGEIRLDRAHTNRELLADLSFRPDLAAVFRSVVDTFDRVWYGFRPITHEEFGEFSKNVGDLQVKKS